VDTGRGMIGDVVPEVPGLEVWPSLPPNSGSLGIGMFSAGGQLLSSTTPGTNQSIRWAADMTTQIVAGATAPMPQPVRVEDWRRGVLFVADGALANNGTKGNPSLVADIFGDWREELLVRAADSSAVRIYLSTELTDRKLYTLMHDKQYRAEVARQQTVYNQPSYTSFYLASDIDWSRVSVPDFWAPGSIGALRGRLETFVDSGDVAGSVVPRLRADLVQADRWLDQDGADEALRRFVQQLEHPGRHDTVSGAAAAALAYQARTVLAMLD
jgi:Rhamnogalacturonan lyase family 11, C-terminal domain/FIMAH domain